MPGNFIGPDGDLENIFVTEYDMIDRYVTTGSLWLWGLNDAGRQLGDNTSNPNSKSSPIQTSISGTNWKEIAYKQDETLSAIKSDGTLWVWGRNSFGQIGMGSTTVINSPVQTIAGGTNWKQVSSGSTTGAIKTDGTLWMWGFNYYGALGDNTRTTRTSPIQTIAGGTNWKQVTSGYNTTAAIKTDGTLWMWGTSNNGALGDNTSVKKSSPVQTVAGGNNWKQLSAGQSCMAIYFYDAYNLYPSA